MTIDGFLDTLEAANRRSFQPRPRTYRARIAALISDQSSGAVTGFTANLDGGGAAVEVAVPPGKGLRAGMTVRLAGPGDDPGAPLEFVEIEYSDDPTAGYGDNADAVVPLWADPDHTTALVVSPGSTTASLTVYWLAVEDRYKPTGYVVSSRLVGGEWHDSGLVPHIPGTVQQLDLGRGFSPGAFVDVKIRAFYAWIESSSGRYSVPTETRTIRAAIDDTSPGDATGLAVDTLVAGTAHFVTAATLVRGVARDFVYYVATGPTGPIAFTVEGPADFVLPLPAGTYYFAVAPIGVNDVVGGRYPAGTGFVGPVVVSASATAVDTTPPDAWAAAPIVSLSRGSDRAFLRVTLPTSPPYAFAGDYDYTEARYSTDGGPIFTARITLGYAYVENLPVRFGTTTVALVAVDKAGNRAAASPTASASMGSLGGPGVAPVVTTESVSEGIVVRFDMPPGSAQVELTRSTTSGGAGETSIAQINGTFYVDPKLPGGAGTAYYYRARGITLAGGVGPWSTFVAGTVGQVDGANIAANSIKANSLEAALVLADRMMTAADGSTRIEIRGGLGVNPNRIQGVEWLSGADVARWLLQGDKFVLYNNAGDQWAGIQRYTGGGVDHAALQAYNGATPRVLLGAKTMQITTNDIPAGQGFLIGDSTYGNLWFARVVHGASKALSLTTGDRLLFTAALQDQTPSGSYFGIKNDGTLIWGTGGTLPDVSLARMAGGSYGTGLDLGLGAFKAGDLYSVRSTAVQGVIFLGNQSGGQRMLHYDGSGYVMPGANLTLNGIVVSSSQEVKRSIRAANLDLSRARALKPRRFRRRDDATDREYLGFIAEDVAEAIPEAVMPGASLPDGSVPAPLGIDPMALIAAQQALIADLEARLTRLEAARP